MTAQSWHFPYHTSCYPVLMDSAVTGEQEEEDHQRHWQHCSWHQHFWLTRCKPAAGNDHVSGLLLGGKTLGYAALRRPLDRVVKKVAFDLQATRTSRRMAMAHCRQCRRTLLSKCIKHTCDPAFQTKPLRSCFVFALVGK